jgi:hypothetical protein
MLKPALMDHLNEGRNLAFFDLVAVNVVPDPMRALEKLIEMFSGQFVFFVRHSDSLKSRL